MQEVSKAKANLLPSESSQRSSANLSSLCQNYNLRALKNFQYLSNEANTDDTYVYQDDDKLKS